MCDFYHVKDFFALRDDLSHGFVRISARLPRCSACRQSPGLPPGRPAILSTDFPAGRSGDRNPDTALLAIRRALCYRVGPSGRNEA